MKKSIYAFTALASLAMASTSAYAAVTFNVNIPGGMSDYVTGTITTDGTIGDLTTANITGWNLTVFGSNAVTTTLVSGNGTALRVGGNALEATATELLFDFSDTNSAYLIVGRTPLFQGGSYFCASGTPGYQDGVPTAEGEAPCFAGISAVPISFSDPSTRLSGAIADVRVLGTVAAVPEPASWLMMISGFGLIGAGMRRRRAPKVKVSYA
jgi:hypothetical protein